MDLETTDKIKERRFYITSLVLTAVAIALGINLTSSWMSAPNSTSLKLLWAGIALVLLGLVGSYLSIRPPRYETQFKIGVFVGPKDAERVAIVPMKHFKWAEVNWAESWNRHHALLATLPKASELNDEDRAVITELLAHLALAKLCKLSSDWNGSHGDLLLGSGQTLVAPGVPYELTTPVPMAREASYRSEIGLYELKMCSGLWGTCRMSVRSVPAALQTVAVSPVFQYAQEPSGVMDTTVLYALTAEVQCCITLTWWGFTFRPAHILTTWFVDIATQLKRECDYPSSMSRLQQMILFELYRLVAGTGHGNKMGALGHFRPSD